MVKGTRSKEYNKGYSDAEKDILDKENIDLFTEGFKAGFRDGYLAAINELSNVRGKMVDNLPPEIKEKFGDEVQPWVWPW